MAGELDAYGDALTAFKNAAAQVMTYANTIVDVGQYMQKHPGDIGFSNLGPGQAMSARITKIVNAKDWPTAAQIQEAINRYHLTHSAMTTAFNNIPVDRRGMVEQPPTAGAPTRRPGY
jgi:hypothetical protein